MKSGDNGNSCGNSDDDCCGGGSGGGGGGENTLDYITFIFHPKSHYRMIMDM
jgi:hypothetical protein